MIYKRERYKNRERFNEQYRDIHRFLSEAEKQEYNEHFHWGRFEWMHAHSCLDEDKLTAVTVFRDENDVIAGLLTYDTCYDDRVYLIHTRSDRLLLESMIDAVNKDEGNGAVLKVNGKDSVLCRLLRENGFEKNDRCSCVLSFDLSNSLEYDMPDAYMMSPHGFAANPWQYQLVIHKGFDNEGIPEKWDDELLKRIPNVNEDLKTFVIADNEYCAHCGLWYSTGDTTAYVEPVVTVPEHRNRGLAKAAVYEACARAKALGAKRAVVVSDLEFYLRIGFTLSSEVYNWTKKN